MRQDGDAVFPSRLAEHSSVAGPGHKAIATAAKLAWQMAMGPAPNNQERIDSDAPYKRVGWDGKLEQSGKEPNVTTVALGMTAIPWNPTFMLFFLQG